MAEYDIRGMKPTDREALLDYGEKFWEMTRYTQLDERPYSRDTVNAVLDLYSNQDDMGANAPGFVLVVTDSETQEKCYGFGIVAMYPLMWDFSIKCAGELAFYIDPILRGTGVAKRLLQSMENVSRNRGAQYMAMISMEHSMDVGPIYEHMGYQKTETTYTKVL